MKKHPDMTYPSRYGYGSPASKIRRQVKGVWLVLLPLYFAGVLALVYIATNGFAL